MSDSVPPTRFHDVGWRVLAYAAATYFRTGSLVEGSELAESICELAEGSDGSLDVNLRPDGVTVRIRVNERGQLTETHAALAGAVSAGARELGAVVDLSGLKEFQIAIDAMVIPDVTPFWEAVLGYERIADFLFDPRFEGPTFWFQQMDAPRPQRNRIHVDLYVPQEQAPTRIDAALAAGGRVVHDADAPEWWTLADPEGNEVDVAPWPDFVER
jgi:4a-hydroxytetrahydrobiopterin dehydratase